MKLSISSKLIVNFAQIHSKHANGIFVEIDKLILKS